MLLRALRVLISFGRFTSIALVTLLLRRVGLRNAQSSNHLIGRQMVNTFVALSGVFIKFGQILAMRPDLLPDEITTQLEMLFDRVDPEPFDLSIVTLQDELGPAIQRVVYIDPVPIAGASFATVYRGRLDDGAEVAIKVQRTGLKSIVRQDTRLLLAFARVVDATGLLKRFRLSQFVREFISWTREELDYQREASHMEYLRSSTDDRRGSLRIPRVYWALVTPRILVMQFFEGVWISDILADRKTPAISRREIAEVIFQSMMFEMFEVGFFHADPHPGNLCVLPDGNVGLIDFGIIGYVTEEMRSAQLNLLSSVQRGNIGEAFRAVMRLLDVPPDANVEAFRANLERNVRDWLLRQHQPNLTALERSGGALLLANFRAARDAGLSFKSEASRYYRTFMLIDSIVARLDEGFDQRRQISNYVQARFLRLRATEVIDVATTLQVHAYGYERAKRAIDALEKLLVDTVPTDLLVGAFNKVTLRISKIVGALAFVPFSVATYLFCLMMLTKLAPAMKTELDSYLKEQSGLSVEIMNPAIWLTIFLMSGLIMKWLARMLWINAYQGQQYTPVARAFVDPRDRSR